MLAAFPRLVVSSTAGFSKLQVALNLCKQEGDFAAGDDMHRPSFVSSTFKIDQVFTKLVMSVRGVQVGTAV